MTANFKAPFLQPHDIEAKASAFLSKYNPKGTLPVPIEEIIEINLGMDIIPVPGLTDISTSDGFLSSDFKSISVDLRMFEGYENRYRFTLAHELGHMFLHKKTYETLNIDSIANYPDIINSLDSNQYGYFEYHAYQFGGCILVPKAPLKTAFDSAVARIKNDGRLDLTNEANLILAHDFISRHLQDTFCVSDGVISRCIKRDGLFI